MTFTVDASIVVKWYIAERHLEEARLLLGHRIERYLPEHSKQLAARGRCR